jgi:AcrR family transcriptional regulator
MNELHPDRTSESRVDGRRARGERSRDAILQRAMDIASVEGLDGLSIGRLAEALDMSKSGVHALFGSKENLQLAAIEAAARTFADEVIRPAAAAGRGASRVEQLCLGWLDYSRRRVFPGGCFFCQVSAEYDARPGRVRDVVALTYRAWVELLERAVENAKDLGEVSADTDTAQLAFELDALVRGANNRAMLEGGDAAYALARAAVQSRLESVWSGAERT